MPKKKATTRKSARGPKRAEGIETAVPSERAASHETAGVAERSSPHLPRIATLFQAIQRDRVGLERSLATKAAVDPYSDEGASGIYNSLVDLEEKAVQYLRLEVSRSKVWPWLSHVKGIGERLGGMLIGLIDIEKCNTPSALWRFAGLAVVCAECGKASLVTACLSCKIPVRVSEQACPRCQGPITRADWCTNCQKVTAGRGERRVKGEKLAYNNILKKTSYLIGRQFIMQAVQPYEGLYRKWREEADLRHPDWPPGRRDNLARRKMIKLFLEHLWRRWREAEGLPTREPYVASMPGHAAYLPPPAETTISRRKKKKEQAP